MNPLIAAAMPLLLLLNRISTLAQMDQPLELQHQVIRQIATFEAQAKLGGCSPKAILAARYCICTAIDEFVLCTAWGARSNWAQQSLLSLVQKETWGGERFFIILEKMLQDPSSALELLELLYLILCLGFEGKYYSQERMVLEEIRHQLFQSIQKHKPLPEKWFCPTINNNQYQTYRYSWLSLWRAPLCIGIFLVGVWMFFNIQTYLNSRDAISQHQKIIAELVANSHN